MKLTKYQKEVVKKISSGEVTDILSYMKTFNLGEYIGLDEKEIKKICREKYNGRFYKVKRGKKQEINRATWKNLEDYEEGFYKANIELSDAKGSSYHYKYGDSFANFPIYEKRYVAKNFSDVINFISLWQYLRSKALIIELPRLLVKEDFSLCTDIIKPYNYEYGDGDYDGFGNNNREQIDQLEDGAEIKLLDSVRDYKEFIDWNFSFSDEKMEIVYSYLSKKIYPAPELGNYVQNKFTTEDEIGQRNNFRIALVGVIIAIATSILSLIGNFASSDLKKIKQELEGIRQEISELDTR